MAFSTSATFHRFCQNVVPIRSSMSITSAMFTTLTAWGQVPLSGIAGTFATYSLFNNDVLVASNLTESTYTILGLDNNVQIGPVTLVPYNTDGTAGAAFMVTGGSGAGKIYTWAQANAPTFSATTSSDTTLACTGSFSNAYVTYSVGGSVTPASGIRITGVNSITQVYTRMTSNTTYTFNIFPVNGDGIPASATGTNMATGAITTLPPPPMWIAAGYGTGNTLAYSTNGIKWSEVVTSSIFSTNGRVVSYSTTRNVWVVVGNGTGNTLAYSNDGITWTGLGKPVFPTSGWYITYSTYQDRWIASGYTSGNTFAFSIDGITWTGLGKSVFSNYGWCVTYGSGAYQNFWLAGGVGGNTLAYSNDGIAWTGLGSSVFSIGCSSISYSEYQTNSLWIAAGQGAGNTLGYSTNGIMWTGLGKNVFSANAYGINYSSFQRRWVAIGEGLGNTLGYSTNGITWTGLGKNLYYAGYGVAYSESQGLWVVAGQGLKGNTLGYSIDGTTWTGLSRSVLYTSASGIMVSS